MVSVTFSRSIAAAVLCFCALGQPLFADTFAERVAPCLACHGEGLRVSGRLAPKVSHPHYTSCTQCHIEGMRSGLTEPAEPAENTFAGVSRAGPGARAWPGAPPTIPHTTWLREDCASCHGLVARPGLRTTHPWQTSCTQCHAPSAALDQATFPPEESHP